MAGELRMSRDELLHGFSLGRELVQEEWAHPQEIAWVDELVDDGKATVVGDWQWHEGFQCKRRVVRGTLHV
jgi:hypothetical protein